ncbi:hypothetical protein BH24ACT26_BH24ACT26_22950 [soil metagenome]
MTLLLGACGGASVSEDSTPGPSSKSGDRSSRSENGDRDRAQSDAAPDFAVRTFTGETFRLAEQRGAPVVLNFWESW